MGLKFLSIAILCLLLTLQVDSHIMAEKPDPFPIPIFVPTADADLWGLIDHDGKLVVPPKYRAIWSFREQPDGNAIALVQGVDSNYGYIDATGREVHPTTLEDAFSVSADGLARFKRDGKFGFMNTDGKPVIPAQYDYAEGMSCERALVMNNSVGSYIDKTGKVVIPGPFVGGRSFGSNGLAAVAVTKKRNAWGYIDTNGNWAIKPAFDRTTAFSENGRAAVATFAKPGINPFASRERLWGVIDETGNWIVKPKYDSIDEFDARGYATFDTHEGSRLTLKHGVLNDRGEELFVRDSSYLEIQEHCDLIRAAYYPGPEFYNFRGDPVEELSRRKFNWIGRFDDTKRAVALREGKWGRVSSNGDFKSWPEEVQEPYVDHYADDVTSIINSDGWSGELIPVIIKGGRLGYVNADNQLAYLTDFEGSPKADTFIFKRSDGTEIWRHRFESAKLAECRNFFLPSDRETGFKAEYLTNIEKVVEKLVATNPTWFEMSMSTSESQEAYDVAEDDREYASYGAVNILGRYYVNQYDLSFYGDFMCAYNGLREHYQSLERQLIAKYGESLELTGDSNEHVKKLRELQQFVMENDRYWDLGEGYLKLDYLADSGDGDIGTTLAIAYLPKKRPK